MNAWVAPSSQGGKNGQKYGLNDNVKTTPGGIASSKMKLKHHYNN
jgi:hypothetical protein